MKGPGKIIENMVRGCRYGLMPKEKLRLMKDHGRIIENMVRGCRYGMIIENMKENL